MGIRSRLLALVIGAALPLAVLGLWGLRREWNVSREHHNELLEQHAELAAVTMEKWVVAQEKALRTIGAAEASIDGAKADGHMRSILTAHPEWMDIRLLDSAGNSVMTEPDNAGPLPLALENMVRAGLDPNNRPLVETDWEDDSSMPVIAIAAPLHDGGAVAVRVKADEIEELFSDLTLQGHADLSVLDQDGKLIYHKGAVGENVTSDSNGSQRVAALGQRPRAVVELNLSGENAKRIYGLARAAQTPYILAVGVPSAFLYEPARQRLAHYLLFTFIALLCTTFAALFIARGIVQPVSRLTAAAHQFGLGNLEVLAPKGGGAELAELSETFNTMAAQIRERETRLAEISRMKSEYVSGVSHELRTPLTTIKTLARLILQGNPSEADRRRYLETIAGQCDRQIDLVLNMLDLSRIESGALSLEIRSVDVAALIAICVKTESAVASLHHHELRTAICPDLPLAAADRSALRRVLCGLLENAIKYTPDGGHILISGAVEGDELVISVTDTGRGISIADLPYVFVKFFRGQSAEDPSAGTEAFADPDAESVPGVGLGLYLAKCMIEQMGGRLTVESKLHHGSRFSVHLPTWRQRDEAETYSDGGVTDVETLANG
jgi:signal transduction histidine kinase